MNKFAFMVIALILPLAMFGCASEQTGTTYSRGDVGQIQEVAFGVVTHARAVHIEGTKTPIGTVAGAAIGGLAGSSVGHDTVSSVAAIAGAVAGGLAGSAAEEAMTRADGVEVTIRMEGGKIISVVQAADPNVQFKEGDKVRVLTINGVIRVAH